MDSNIFKSIKENFVQRTTNPFLGTLIFVWIIRNWKFVYSFFFFDSTYSLNDKLIVISCYFEGYSPKEFGVTIAISFGVLITTYILTNLSRLIVTFFDKIVTPKILSVTHKSSLVLRSDYLEVIKTSDIWEKRYSEEREKRIRAENDLEKLEKRISEVSNPKEKQGEISKSESNFDSDEDTVMKLYSKLKSNNQMSVFKDVVRSITEGNSLERKDPDVKRFVDYDLIVKSSDAMDENLAYYRVTDLGGKLRRKFIDLDL
ncbi:hypothetical protein SAMN05192553_102671 [Cyclobacterium xiamenense]|uniref:Uncharacterized protein n=1 Tax=Cyclobacterium xiamenense TaxID=1297121 RepID=A0A1H6WJ24_9BACT|nr:hypothetical protein [Cyclobacterium xiamenense]SEJ15706.1 hypothetical protein SAMN05192553_102671 [Cyclobacterium xiamenense]